MWNHTLKVTFLVTFSVCFGDFCPLNRFFDKIHDFFHESVKKPVSGKKPPNPGKSCFFMIFWRFSRKSWKLTKFVDFSSDLIKFRLCWMENQVTPGGPRPPLFGAWILSDSEKLGLLRLWNRGFSRFPGGPPGKCEFFTKKLTFWPENWVFPCFVKKCRFGCKSGVWGW